jgi:ribose transport system ATP-binding protein
LKALGVGIVYVSHRLGEVLAVADRIVGLRDGRNSGELPAREATHERLVAMMVGRTLSSERRTPHRPGDVVLRVQGLCTAAFPRAQVDLELRAGEVVGLAGLLGSGRSELLRALFGADRAVAGHVEVRGVRLRGHDPAAAAQSGLVLLPEDRKQQGLVLGMSVLQNLSLPTLHRRGRFVDRDYERELCQRSVAELSIAASSGEQIASTLSGGNQQKVVLGKWLAAEPAVLLLDEPTRGVDVETKAELYRLVAGLAEQGLGVVMVSSEIEELIGVCTRILVMREGELVAELDGESATELEIIRLSMPDTQQMVTTGAPGADEANSEESR